MDLAFTGLSPPRELLLLLGAVHLAHLGGDGVDRRTGGGIGELAAQPLPATITHPGRQPKAR